MIEKLIVLEDVDPIIFYGVNNTNMQLIKALYPKLRIIARGNVIKVLGDEEELCAFEENIIKLQKYCTEFNSLKEEVIIDIIKGNAPQAEKSGNVIVFSVVGKPIIPRSENQMKLVEAFNNSDLTFAVGPAGKDHLREHQVWRDHPRRRGYLQRAAGQCGGEQECHAQRVPAGHHAELGI